MKPKTNTTEQLELPFAEGDMQSEPPAVAGGLTGDASQAAGIDAKTDGQVQPPEGAGGSDSTPAGADLDALRAENEQLKAQIRLDAAHRQITGELAEAGARSPELLFKSISGKLEFGEDGEVVNAADLLEKLKTSYPEQFGHAAAVGGIDGAAGTHSQPRLTRDALAKMKTEEIAALDWADVRRVLANG